MYVCVYVCMYVCACVCVHRYQLRRLGIGPHTPGVASYMKPKPKEAFIPEMPASVCHTHTHTHTHTYMHTHTCIYVCMCVRCFCV